MKIKVLFILPSLKAGGAERVFSFVPQYLNANVFNAQLLIVGHKEDSVYPTGHLKVTYLGKDRIRNGVLEIIRFLRREKPNVVLGSIGHLNIVLGIFKFIFPKTKVVVREASVVSVMDRYSNVKRMPFDSIITKLAYRKVDTIICQSNDMAEDFKALYNIPDKKIARIGNPITNLQHRPKNDDTHQKPLVKRYITVGRLSVEKGHERILNLLVQSKVKFLYTIVGDGPEKENIADQIRKLGCSSQVMYIPHSSEVNKLLKSNDMFIQGSYVEGFPNAVLESCTVGTPVLAFNAPGGTRDIIEDGINGFIAESEEEFLHYLNADYAWNRNAVANSVIAKYSPEIIISRYENLIKNLLN